MCHDSFLGDAEAMFNGRTEAGCIMTTLRGSRRDKKSRCMGWPPTLRGCRRAGKSLALLSHNAVVVALDEADVDDVDEHS